MVLIDGVRRCSRRTVARSPVADAEPAADGVHGEPAGAVGEQAPAAFGESEQPVSVRVGGRVAEQGVGSQPSALRCLLKSVLVMNGPTR
jgi:hypothetical protein